MRFFLVSSLFLGLILGSQIVSAEQKKICDNIAFESKETVTFTENEKKLICGDPKSDSWAHIPHEQAKLFIKAFLQDRGRHQPSFRQAEGVLYVTIGPVSNIKKVKIIGSPPKGFQLRRRNPSIGKTMTPEALDDLGERSLVWLQSHGYACPEVNVSGNPKEEIVAVEILPGDFGIVAGVMQEPLPGLQENILRRYDAFVIGKPYDIRGLDLSLNRAEADGIVQHTHFTTECKGSEVYLEQKAIIGKPRLFTIGFGANTEGYLMMRSSWKHTRLGQNASSLEFGLFASFLRQEFSASSKWYFLPQVSRWHFNPSITLKREDEKKYELISADIKALPATSWETRHFNFSLSFGPELNFTRTFRGPGEGTTHYFSTYIDAKLLSHDFEYYASDPLSGYSLQFSADLNHKNIFSDITAQRFSLSGQWLYNVKNLNPPFLIIGLRGNISTTLTDRGDGAFSKLPPYFSFYLGGSPDLRGFNRGELSASTQSDTGALTSFFSSLELRFANVLPLDIQPLLFADVGMLGEKSAYFNQPLYWSPGIGLRWLSKIGTFRTTLAHGFEVGRNVGTSRSHWQWYFSFGEEF